MSEDYIPISCSFYDRLEEAITVNKKVEFSYYSEDLLLASRTKLVDLVMRNKKEFVILEDGTEVRLDRIFSLDGIQLQDKC